jgi:hypothetical protein
VIFLTVTLALAVSLSASAGQDILSNRANRVMSGVVTDVTPTDVTVRAGDNLVIFKIDKSTSVIANGATHKNDLVYREPDRPRTIKDFVKTGDTIRVRYRPIDDALLAVDLLVTTKRTTR